MANLQVHQSFDYIKIVFISDSDNFLSETSFTKSTISWKDGFDTAILKSNNEDFDGSNDDWTGAVSSLTIYSGGELVWEIEGISYALSSNSYDNGYSIGGFTFYEDLADLADILSGDDNITGSASADRLAGFFGNDSINGGAGNDWIEGWGGTDTLYGENGNDTLQGGIGLDELYGGSGDDVLNGGADTTADIIDGGAGTDTVSFAFITNTSGVNLTLGKYDTTTKTTTQTAATGGSTDKVSNVENITGSKYADVLTGNGANNVINGGAGKDTLTGGSGADKFIFDTTLNASTNLDTIKDFAKGTDKLVLKDDIFTKLTGTTAGVTLDSKFFSTSSKPGTGTAGKDDYFYFTNNTLYYDADGNGTGTGTAVVKLTGVSSITASDIQIIA
jgi:Ca2+-binding RTX toxin-like protein